MYIVKITNNTPLCKMVNFSRSVLKIYTGQKKFTRAAPVAPVTNIRYGSWQHVSVNKSSVAELSPVYCCLVSSYTDNLTPSVHKKSSSQGISMHFNAYEGPPPSVDPSGFLPSMGKGSWSPVLPPAEGVQIPLQNK